MPLRTVSQMWANYGPVNVAYQFLAGPNENTVRRNMAVGGSDYGLLDITSAAGWTWDKTIGRTFTPTNYIANNNSVIVPMSNFTVIARITAPLGDAANFICGSMATNNSGWAIGGNAWLYSAKFGMNIRNTLGMSKDYAIVASLAGDNATYALRVWGTTATAWINGQTRTETTIDAIKPVTRNGFIVGCKHMSSIPQYGHRGTIKALVLYDAPLSDSAIVQLSNQIANCEKNPDWSVWTPKRRWFYGRVEELIAARRRAMLGVGY